MQKMGRLDGLKQEWVASVGFEQESVLEPCVAIHRADYGVAVVRLVEVVGAVGEKGGGG